MHNVQRLISEKLIVFLTEIGMEKYFSKVKIQNVTGEKF